MIILFSMEYHVYWVRKSSCFELFGDGKYGLYLIQKGDGKIMFTWYLYLFFYEFCEIFQNTFFSQNTSSGCFWSLSSDNLQLGY